MHASSDLTSFGIGDFFSSKRAWCLGTLLHFPHQQAKQTHNVDGLTIWGVNHGI